MFLYRQIAKGHDMVQLFEGFEEACEKARQFVGEHNDIDGCSSQREERRTIGEAGLVFRTWRSTSFGQRRATVRRIHADKMVGID